MSHPPPAEMGTSALTGAIASGNGVATAEDAPMQAAAQTSAIAGISPSLRPLLRALLSMRTSTIHHI
jgi:hypothetical protein